MRRSEPTVALGLPLYNGTVHLREAVGSLLAQSFADYVLVIVDDASTDGGGAVAQELARDDPRVTYVRNESRLGLARNWRRAYVLAREQAPDAPFFAWTSDHDVWNPHWLETLVGALERRPGAALVYPSSNRIDADGRELRRASATGFGTREGAGRLERFLRTVVGVPSGNAIYGLFRVSALEAAGGFPVVVAPDRVLLAQIALEGAIVRVPEQLWTRRFRHTLSLDRQRRAIFPEGGVPGWVSAPWVVQHVVVLAAASRRSGASRAYVAAAAAYPAAALVRFGTLRTRRVWRRLRKAGRRLRACAAALRR